MKNVSADIALKNYWSNNERFADLFNQVLFKGKEIIKAENLTATDTNESSLFFDKQGLGSISRYRDVIKQFGEKIDFVLVGIENQTKVHYAMPVRTMLYDALGYTNQCKELENEHRKAKDLSTSEEFLSNMKKEDRIKPVVTLVLYYGEKPWDGPESLSDMMNIPSGFEPLLNNHKMHLLQMGKAEGYHFKNKDNAIFFTVVSEFYNMGSIDLGRFKEKYPQLKVFWETLVAIGAATNSKKLIDYAQEEKGDIYMCTALDNLVRQGREEGRLEEREIGLKMLEEVREQGIYILINSLKQNGVKEESIINSVVTSYKMPYDEVKGLLGK